MRLFSHYGARNADARGDGLPVRYAVPRSPEYYTGQVTFVETAVVAWAMADLAHQQPLSHVGLDTEFRFTRAGVAVKGGKVVNDVRSIQPLLLSLALAIPEARDRTGGRVALFVVNVGRPETYPALRSILRLPVPVVGHALKSDVLCLFQLGLPEPELLWDTWVCSRSMYLGRHHRKYTGRVGADEADEAVARRRAADDEEVRHSLLAVCQRHGISHQFGDDKARLQRSFLDHPAAAPYSEEQIYYAAQDALAVARLYHTQVTASAQAGLLHHLLNVEMRWVVTNARMLWRGVHVDAARCQAVQRSCSKHLEALRPQLAEHGIDNVRSHPQLKRFFQHTGLLDLFRRDGKLSFDKEALDDFHDRHPAISPIRAAKKVLQLQGDKLLTGDFVGADGRVHADHVQLGTDTGRQTCRWPNVLGLGKVFRPLITAEAGWGIGEVDLCQIEVGLAAAVYHDERLIEMFNDGDVYSAMAQHFYRDQLTSAARSMSSLEFKRLEEHGWMRTQMKRCTLGIIYGLTAHGLALYLDVNRSEAASLQDRFMAMFPALRKALVETVRDGAVRGHVPAVSGLRRYCARRGQVSTWERNWMTNHPVQGSAAVVFKAAGNRLDRLYRSRDAWLIVPLHDAYVFEAPLAALEEVAVLTERVLCEAVQEYFPQLRPRAEVNVGKPHCWNKDGRDDSLERWIADPTFSLETRSSYHLCSNSEPDSAAPSRT
jgi:DNA polymerase-1